MSVSVKDIPYGHVVECIIPEHAAGDPTDEHIVLVAPEKCYIREVAIVPCANITGQATNYFNLNVITRKADGSSPTEIANRDYVAGVNETLGVKRVLFDGADGSQILEKGGTIDIQRELVGTGLATPQLLVTVLFDLA